MKKLLLAVALGLAGLVGAQAQQVYPRIATLGSGVVVRTNITQTVNASTNLFATFNYMHDLAVLTTITSTNNVGTAYTVTNNFDLSLDGTTWTTTQPLNTVATCNGTTTVVSLTVIPKTSLGGCKAIRLTNVGTGSTNYVSVTTQLGIMP